MPFSIHLHRRCSAPRLTIIAVLFFIYTPVHAGLCMPPVVEKESLYQYLLTLTNAMGYTKSALDRIPKTMKSQSSYDDFLVGLELGKADFECAASQVSPYLSSSTEPIRISAQRATSVFASLVALQEKSIVQYAAILNSTDGRGLERRTALEKQAQLGAAHDETWKHLISAAQKATSSAVEADTTTRGMSGLALTANQRDEILQNLWFTFGEEITKGRKAGQLPLVAAAADMYHVIGNQSKKTRASK